MMRYVVAFVVVMTVLLFVWPSIMVNGRRLARHLKAAWRESAEDKPEAIGAGELPSGVTAVPDDVEKQ